MTSATNAGILLLSLTAPGTQGYNTLSAFAAQETALYASIRSK